MNLLKSRLLKISGIMTLIWSIMLLQSQVMAQTTQVVSQEVVAAAILAVFGLTTVVLIGVIFALRSLKKSIRSDDTETGDEVDSGPSWWSNLMVKRTEALPVEQEADVILDHNHLLPWWKWLFILSVISGVAYLLVYHVFDSRPLQIGESEISMNDTKGTQAARQGALEESGEAFLETDLQYTDDPAVIASGEVIYNRQCMVCHRDDGGGGIGPNFTDQYWIHGGTISEIYYIIKVGVPDKGMISWEALLTPEQMRDVSVYIITLVGTNPENAKAPQGDLFEGDPKENRSTAE